jgi:hypothetical protein
MNEERKSGQVPPQAGLCAACRHAVVVTSDRGSRFVRCARAETDPSFPRYPPLPVLACRGVEPMDRVR